MKRRTTRLLLLAVIALTFPVQSVGKAETTGKITFQKETTSSTPSKETLESSGKQPSSAPATPSKSPQKDLPNTGEVLRAGLSLVGLGVVLFVGILFWRRRKREKG